ncbi:LUD domain-containing protein [Halobaculum gomorrense]|uniref:L-lactate utilization protein LutB, contains a ferredoxin-type domain n=1 Tax=Halobaculum gomorrense TaxID=43928 RepID=A0A1M5RNF6_9EURY|nr:LUD domain-containing protein [Halobaculum gomorrense]SHH27814.1 L-lactate utilization protein LutB, contains a ferredoxin-type domain [Halobaculum gomorrense]
MSKPDSRAETAARIRHLLDTEGDAVAENTRGFNRGRYESTGELADYEALKDEARAIKEDAIERLPELIDDLREAVEARGGHLYVADDAADANAYVREVVDGDNVVKSKSMTTEELDLNEALAADDARVTETDLGEWVLQLADEAPSHIVGPAIHKSREGIADLFAETFDLDGDDRPETAEELTRFAREKLLADIREADVGVTGANFLTADSGTMALVTSEGNARKTVVVPDTHVAVAGVEKVIPSVENLAPFVELIGRSGTGQDITSYVSLFTPPVPSPPVEFGEARRASAERTASAKPDAPMADPGTAAGDGATEAHPDREFHLVLVDNGRLDMREDDDLRETLYCIRCGACSNSCGNFQSVGGHAFGGETYSGGIATGWEAGVEGLDTAAEFNDLCTGCSRCVPACPVQIDIPWINTVVRDRINRGADPGAFDPLVEGLTPDDEPAGLAPSKRLFGNFETLARLGSATAPLSNWGSNLGPVRAAMDRWLGVAPERDLPAFERETLVDWFAARGGPRVSERLARREAVVYPDVYTNYADVDRGKAVVRTLEALGVRVHVPGSAAVASGRAPLSQGMIETARGKAERCLDALLPEIDAGRDVVVIEPSDLAAFDREYGKLIPETDADRLADGCYEVLEYVYGLLENGADPGGLTGGDGDAVAYHAHCQQRTLELEPYTVAVLERLGYDVTTSETECCGMAGSFGYKSAYYELSMDVGEPLVEQFGDADRVLASGTSCGEQLDALLDSSPEHPIKAIAPL